MTLADFLLVVSVGLLILDVPVAWILVRAAWKKPHIWALTLMAIVSVGIAILVLVYLLAVANTAAGYPIPKEAAQVGFRLAALVMALFPPLFLFVYRTGRFRDGGNE